MKGEEGRVGCSGFRADGEGKHDRRGTSKACQVTLSSSSFKDLPAKSHYKYNFGVELVASGHQAKRLI